VQPAVKISELFLDPFGVLLPRFAIDPRRGIPAQGQECRVKAFQRHVVEERGEPHSPVLSRDLSHAVQRLGHA
jgi:hypothetical protein